MSKLDSELDPISISGDTLDDNQANLDVKDVLQSSSKEVYPRERTWTGLTNWKKRPFPSLHRKMQHSRPI